MSLKVSKKRALIELYQSMNGPAQAGRVWVTYPRKQVEAMIDLLKQIMRAEGMEFREETK